MTVENLDQFRMNEIEFRYAGDSRFEEVSAHNPEDPAIKELATKVDISLSPKTLESEETTLQVLRFMRLRAGGDNMVVGNFVAQVLQVLETEGENASEGFLERARQQNQIFRDMMRPGVTDEEEALSGVFRPNREDLQAAREALADSTLLNRYPNIPKTLPLRRTVSLAGAQLERADFTTDQINPGADTLEHEGGMA